MPPLSQLPGNIPRKKFLKALARIGFIIETSGGQGSHIMVLWPSTQKSVTIPHEHIPKQVLKYLLKEIEVVTREAVTWEKIQKEL